MLVIFLDYYCVSKKIIRYSNWCFFIAKRPIWNFCIPFDDLLYSRRFQPKMFMQRIIPFQIETPCECTYLDSFVSSQTIIILGLGIYIYLKWTYVYLAEAKVFLFCINLTAEVSFVLNAGVYLQRYSKVCADSRWCNIPAAFYFMCLPTSFFFFSLLKIIRIFYI